MPVPQRYGVQTAIGAVVILMGLGFVGAQLFAPPASNANNPQAVARPTPRIIEINTKREDFRREDIKQTEPINPLNAPIAQPTPKFAEPETPPVSAAELKRKAQEEAPQIVEGATDIPPEAAGQPPRSKNQSRARYPKYDRHAVY